MNRLSVQESLIYPEPASLACPVEAMRAWLPLFSPEYVWPTRSDRTLQRQNIVDIVVHACRRAGLHHTAASLPRLDTAQRLQLAQHLHAGNPKAMRDHAWLLNQWGTAHRVSELRVRCYDDVRLLDQGVEWTVNGPIKNARDEPGHIVGALAFPEEPTLCQRLAMLRWMERLELMHGRPLNGDDPLFPALSNNTDLSTPISSEGLGRMIKARCRSAGILGDFSTHSLRAGMVRDAIDADVPEEHVRRQGRWVSDTVRRYWRQRAVLGRANPAYRVQRERLSREELDPQS